MKLYKCIHMGLDFTAKVWYSRKHKCWVIDTSYGDRFRLSSEEKVKQILASYDKCEEVSGA